MAIRANGKDAVALTVFRRLGGNALAVSRDLDGVLADAAKSAPPGVEIHPVYDQGLLVRTAIANVRDAIIIGGLMSVAVLLLFLKSLRATLIAALSIPLSLIISFVFLHLTGDTLNLMSLGGLAVAIGLIIDDTVVVIENIARHLAEGQTGDAAVDRASREISGAVIGSTLTTILVFVPLAFVRGVVGQFFQSLSISLTVALLVSMVVSLTIIPVLAARFLGRRPMPTTGPIYNLLADVYERALKVGLRFPKTVMLLALLAVVPGWILLHGLTIPLGKHSIEIHALETGFMPDMDEGAFVLDYNMPVGTSLAQTDKVHAPGRGGAPADARRLRATSAGPAPSSASSPPSRTPATSWSASSPPASAGRSSEIVRRASRGARRPRSPSWRPSSCRWCRTRSTTWRASTARSRSRSSAPTSRRSATLAEQVGKVVEEVAGAADVNAHVYLGNPDIVVRPDSVQTARVGLTELDVEAQLNAALYGQVASTVPEQDRMTKIRVRYPDRVRYDRDHLALLPISLATATPRQRRREPRDGRRGRLRPAWPTGDDPYGSQPQRAVARKPAARHHRDRRAGRPRPGLGQPRAADEACRC